MNSNKVWEKADTTDAVSSVFGRQGAVVAQTGDYDDVQVDYTRDDLDKKSIQASSDNVGSAINDLDDNKLARNGSQAMTGDLDMGANNITNVATVDGVDVSNHASRHLPNGSDPITTAIANTISNNNNSVGTNNSLSRSDHTHKLTQNNPIVGQLVRWDGSNWNPHNLITGYNENDTTQSTTSTTFTQALRLTINIPVTGNYFIEWSYEASNSQKDRDTVIRVQIDDTTTIHEVSHGRQNDQITPAFYAGSGFKRANLTAGSHDIDIDYRAQANTASIRNIRVVVKKLD